MKDLAEYLTSEIKDFLFSELDDSFLFANDLGFLSGIPVPIGKDDLKSFAEKGLSTTKLADNMAFVIGADSKFKYTEKYICFFKQLFDDKLCSVLDKKGEDLLKNSMPRKGLCYIRAALLLSPKAMRTNFCYANACRFWYQSMEGEDCEELISILKKEANDYLSLVTSDYPNFAPAWYFLGYAYLNSGSYIKAEIAFKHYLDATEEKGEEETKEVKERLEELRDPVKIENGKDLLAAGRIEEALAILEPYTQSKYANWWPLHYYLAVAYEQLDLNEEAKEGYLNVIRLNPSNYDATMALADLYSAEGNEEKALKYSNKAKIILENNKK